MTKKNVFLCAMTSDQGLQVQGEENVQGDLDPVPESLDPDPERWVSVLEIRVQGPGRLTPVPARPEVVPGNLALGPFLVKVWEADRPLFRVHLPSKMKFWELKAYLKRRA